jgi:hypothetical protein
VKGRIAEEFFAATLGRRCKAPENDSAGFLHSGYLQLFENAFRSRKVFWLRKNACVRTPGRSLSEGLR